MRSNADVLHRLPSLGLRFTNPRAARHDALGAPTADHGGQRSQFLPISMKNVLVCSLDELPDNSMRVFEIGGRELVFVRDGNQIYAMRNLCPHQGAKLSEGILSCHRIPADVGEYLTEDGCSVVRCPWHNWEFDFR